MLRARAMFVAVLVLLVLRGARADEDHNCYGPRQLHISSADGVKSQSASPLSPYENLRTTYRKSVDIFCTGAAAKDLIITLDGVPQPSETIDMKTLKLTLEKLTMKVYFFTCLDWQGMCYTSMEFTVGPELVIKSENVRQRRLLGVHSNWYEEHHMFFVLITEDYEIVCCGSQAELLHICDYNRTFLPSVVVNETCIKSEIMDKPEVINRHLPVSFRCQVVSNDTQLIENSVWTYVDYPPAATSFWCIGYSVQISCSWRASSLYTSFRLLVRDVLGNHVPICEDQTNKETRFCEWSLKYALAMIHGFQDNDRIIFVLESCNLVYCNNEAFHINLNSIMKGVSPRNLRTLEIGSYSAQVQWSNDYGNVEFVHKLMYRLTGMEWVKVDSSSIHINRSRDIMYYSVELKLPCSSSLYQVKIYARYASTPEANDAYWSDPASIFFYTNSQYNSTFQVDNICNAEPELLTNMDTAATYAVKVLKRDAGKVAAKLHKKVDALKQKLAVFEEAKKALTP